MALVYAEKYTANAMRELSREQRKEQNDKLINDIAAVASDSRKPKTKRAVECHLQMLRMDPAKLDAHMNKGREHNGTINHAKHNLANNELTALKKREDHLTYMKEIALVKPRRLSDTQVHFLSSRWSREACLRPSQTFAQARDFSLPLAPTWCTFAAPVWTMWTVKQQPFWAPAVGTDMHLLLFAAGL